MPVDTLACPLATALLHEALIQCSQQIEQVQRESHCSPPPVHVSPPPGPTATLPLPWYANQSAWTEPTSKVPPRRPDALQERSSTTSRTFSWLQPDGPSCQEFPELWPGDHFPAIRQEHARQIRYLIPKHYEVYMAMTLFIRQDVHVGMLPVAAMDKCVHNHSGCHAVRH